jgi:hypothetical protein
MNKGKKIDKADSIDDETTPSKESISDIKDILPKVDERFHYPLLRDFLEGQNPRDAILRACEIITGSYGESAIVYFEGHKIGYRSTSKMLIDQVKQLLISNKFPINVHVAKIKSRKEIGYPYYTLNATGDLSTEGEEKKEL